MFLMTFGHIFPPLDFDVSMSRGVFPQYESVSPNINGLV